MAEYTNEQLNEIDRLVAEKVMGWTLSASSPAWNADNGSPPMPTIPVWVKEQHPWNRILVAEWSPTRNNGQAMEVFEQCPDMVLYHSEEGYGAEQEKRYRDEWPLYEANAPTPRLAICLAALQRVDVEVPQ